MKPDEIILSAIIRHRGVDPKISKQIKDYLSYRKTTQPLATKNCGSVFKNSSLGAKAGITVDAIGLKQFGKDKLHVSPLHGNFIENHSSQVSTDFVELTDLLKEEMERYSGIKFELEVKIY